VTRPLLYVSNILPQVDPDLAANGEVDQMVQAGIDRLFSMQTPSGGFGVWPGSTEPVLWGTAYVVHLMLDAQERGYDVSPAALQDAIDWLDRNAESDRGGPKFRGTHPGYVHYVLARGGKGHAATIQSLIQANPNPSEGKEIEGHYLLMAALYQAGDRRHERALRAVDTSPVDPKRLNDWSYYSDLRRRGMTLAVFHELFGRDGSGDALADRVATTLGRNKAGYFTTQELMWGVSGLGKWVGTPPKGLPSPTLWFNGREVPPDKERDAGDGQVAWQIGGAQSAEKLELRAEGAAANALTLVSTTHGVKMNHALPTGGDGLAVSRRYRTSDGGVLDARHDLGALVYVEVSLQNTTGRKVENIALVDRIPAGWEIENPRLGRGGLPDWADDDLWVPEYMDIRDDRFQVFGPVESGETVHMVYAIRAVTAGQFTIPPLSAEAMYDPTLWARTEAQTLRIDGGWEGLLL